jgi:hypothetical protein
VVLPRLGRSKDHGAPVGHQVDEELAVLEEVPGRAARQQQELIAARVPRLPRVLGIEIDTCVRCGGMLRIIACIEETRVHPGGG